MNASSFARRRILLGGAALTASCMIPKWASAAAPAARDDMAEYHMIEIAEEEQLDPDLSADAALHAPFRAAFLSWLDRSSERFALPVTAHLDSPTNTELRVPGLNPALEISLHGAGDINVYVTWKTVFWDILASLDVYAVETEDGASWRNTLLLPEAQRVHATREACWRQDGFEELLTWFNNDLAPATHLVLCGSDGCDEGLGWTAAQLARDGLLVRSGKPLVWNGAVRELLPLYTASA